MFLPLSCPGSWRDLNNRARAPASFRLTYAAMLKPHQRGSFMRKQVYAVVQLDIVRSGHKVSPGGPIGRLRAFLKRVVDRVEVEDFILFHRHIYWADAGQGLADPGNAEAGRRLPMCRHVVLPRGKIGCDPIKAVGRNRALIEGDKTPAGYGCALGREHREKIGADLE
jgi:hypothetical protein